jgi:hypothetical protein
MTNPTDVNNARQTSNRLFRTRPPRRSTAIDDGEREDIQNVRPNNARRVITESPGPAIQQQNQNTREAACFQHIAGVTQCSPVVHTSPGASSECSGILGLRMPIFCRRWVVTTPVDGPENAACR